MVCAPTIASYKAYIGLKKERTGVNLCALVGHVCQCSECVYTCPHTVVLEKQPLLIWGSPGQSQMCAQTLKQSRGYVL